MFAEFDTHQYELFQFPKTCVWFVSDTYCISACMSTCCFPNLSLCQIDVFFLKTGKMRVHATFSVILLSDQGQMSCITQYLSR